VPLAQMATANITVAATVYAGFLRSRRKAKRTS
jgi:hypothetical protein